MFECGEYPLVDLSSFLNDQKNAFDDCKLVADLLHRYGFLCVRDPRVNDEYNEEFIDMLEEYYEQSDEIKGKDIRKDVFYQVGLTPTRVERARNRCSLIETLDPTEKPLTICPPGKVDNLFDSMMITFSVCRVRQ